MGKELEKVATLPDDAEVKFTGKEIRAILTEKDEETKTLVETESKRAAESAIADFAAKQTPEIIRAVSDIRVGEMRDPHKAYTDDPRAVAYGQFMRAFATAEGNLEKTKQIIEGWEKVQETPAGQRTLRAMNETNFTDGGAFVQQQYASEYIQLLRNKAIVRRSGCRVIQMPQGNLSMGEITSGASSYWRGEGQSATSSQLGTGSLNLASKELVTQVPISKKLLRHAALSFDVIVRDDAIQSGALAEDSAFIRSVGSQFQPKGLRYLAYSGNVFPSAGATLANIRTDTSKAKLKLKRANIPMTNPNWLMSHTTEEALMNYVDANSNLVWAAEMAGGKFRGYPYFASNQIPDNLGSGSDAELYLYDAFECFIADDGAVSVELATNVSYKDSNGVLVSAFDRGEVVIQVVQSMDMDARYKKAIAVVTGVQYAA